MNINVTISANDVKAIEANIGVTVQEWLQHAINNEARQCRERVVYSVTNYNPKKLSKEEVDDIIKDVEVEELSEERQKKALVDRLTYKK
jgi:predicted methyltransferase MtxX (methanogen marker protein 4)